MSLQVTVSAVGDTPVRRVWALLSSPAAWPAWAPHMAHVSSIGSTAAPARVHVGQRVTVHSVVPRVALSVTVTEVIEGQSWTMVAHLPIGLVRSGHHLSRTGDRTVVRVDLHWSGPRAVGTAVLGAYRPLAAMSLRRLLRLADADARGAQANALRMCLPSGQGEPSSTETAAASSGR